ncbi:MAG: hypothetical protein DRO23_05680, partial [Thermoprotei archaeon]
MGKTKTRLQIRKIRKVNPKDPTYYLTNSGTGYTSLWLLSETAPTEADTTTILDLGKADVCEYMKVIPGTENSTVLTDLPTDFDGYGWRTNDPLSVTFKAGTWTFQIKVQSNKYGVGIDVYVRLWKSQYSDGSNAVALTDWLLIVSNYSLAGNTTVTLSGTADLPQITLDNEYLFVEYCFHVSSAPESVLQETTFIVNDGDEFITTPEIITVYTQELSETITLSDYLAKTSSKQLDETVTLSDYVRTIYTPYGKTSYDKDFTIETFPVAGLTCIYIRKSAGYYPTLGIDSNGLYIEDTDTEYFINIGLIPILPHKLQGFEAKGTFMHNLSDLTVSNNAGFVIGGSSDRDKIYIVHYAVKTQTLKIRYYSYSADAFTTVAETTETYAIGNNVPYKIKVVISYDDVNKQATVSAYLLDENENVLLSLENVSITDFYPVFGIYLKTGITSTGKIWCKEYTVTFDGSPNLDKMESVLSPDYFDFDWIGAPNLVWFQHSDGLWYPYNENGERFITVRLHGEASGTGDRIDMYKVEDFFDKTKWTFVQTVFSRDQLGWSVLEEFQLFVKNDGTWIAITSGGDVYHPHIIESTDNGESWTDKKTLTEYEKFHNAFVEPDGTIYFTTRGDGTVYVLKTTDFFETYTEIYSTTDYGMLIIYKYNNTWKILARKIESTDNATYWQLRTDLLETTDWTTVNFVKTYFIGDLDCKFTVYENGINHNCMVEINGTLYVVAEMVVIDRDIDDDFTDQRQKHVTVLYRPVYVPVLEVSLQETITLSDVYARSYLGIRELPETLTLTDYIETVYTPAVHVYTQELSETITLSDVYARQYLGVKSLTETTTLSDVYLKVPSKVYSETITLSDVLETVKTYYRMFSETITLTDYVLKTGLKQFTETITLTDVFARTYLGVKTFSETITLSDYIELVKKFVKLLEETVTLTDYVELVKILVKILSETTVLTDYSVRLVSKPIAETITLMDYLAKTPVKQFTETTSLTDVLEK